MSAEQTAGQNLTIVPAGAGAGKTHRIKTQLMEWIKNGEVAPERILAVTFTEAAAGELRDRIRAGLLAERQVEQALAVERAYISTIHGLGLRLLTEHALAAGTSLEPRHIGDAERDLLVRQALAKAKALDPIKADPERFGYRNNWQTGITIEDALRGRVLAMIDLLRGLGDAGRTPDLIEPALTRLDRIHGNADSGSEAARDTLIAAIRLMLASFPNGGMEGVTAKGPTDTLEKNLALFQRVDRDPGILDRDWNIWQSLRGLFVSNSRTKTPEGYDDLADEIMRVAGILPKHAGPIADAGLHLQCLISCAQEVMETYEARKKALGLIDFSDMITGAERLLRTDPVVRQAVLDGIDCVIIDEFQDTNPVQFALLWHLGAHAPRTLLVGDVKQSIMGFQGADPRLSEALAAANSDAIDPLGRNWRSTPEIMEFVNAMGGGLFKANYNALEPTRQSAQQPALEILNATRGRAVRNFSKPQEHVAERIAGLLKSGEMITDRHTGRKRNARPSDMALLVCRHTTAVRYARELRVRGVPVRIAEMGWMESPVVRVARAALLYAANPEDIHSGILLRTSGPNPMGLQEAITAHMKGILAEDPMLLKLAALSDQLVEMPVSNALSVVLDTSGLRDWAGGLADGAQAHADLLRLEAEANAFETAHRELKAASGFYGETAQVFSGWLESRTLENDFDYRPDPSGNSAEAVEIVTWHASKGREWPITVVAELDHAIEEWPESTAIRFDALDRIDDPQAVLNSAVLVHTPGFAAPEAERRFIEDRRAAFEANARNLLYVALTRARDRIIMEWPGFIKDRSDTEPGAKNLFHVLLDSCCPELEEDVLRIGGVDCPAIITKLPDHAGVTQYGTGLERGLARFGDAPIVVPDAPIVGSEPVSDKISEPVSDTSPVTASATVSVSDTVSATATGPVLPEPGFGNTPGSTRTGQGSSRTGPGSPRTGPGSSRTGQGSSRTGQESSGPESLQPDLFGDESLQQDLFGDKSPQPVGAESPQPVGAETPQPVMAGHGPESTPQSGSERVSDRVSDRTLISRRDESGTFETLAVQGDALHLAMRTCLVRPDLVETLPAATGLDADILAPVESRAKALKDWLSNQGYTGWECEFPVKGQGGRSSDSSGFYQEIDLLAIGPDGCLLMDCKSDAEGLDVESCQARLSNQAISLQDAIPALVVNSMAIYRADDGSIDVLDLSRSLEDAPESPGDGEPMENTDTPDIPEDTDTPTM